MAKTTLLLGLLLLVCTASGCGRKPPPVPEPPAAPQASSKQSYIHIEPSRKSAGHGRLGVQPSASPAEIGLVFYPKATVVKSGVVRGPKGAVAAATLQTTQPYAEVVDYYREKYQAQKPTVKTRQETHGAVTMLNWQDQQGNYTIVIQRDDLAKRTTIALVKTSR